VNALRQIDAAEQLASVRRALYPRFAVAEAACIFASYGVKPGDIEGLATAKANGKVSSLVRVRYKDIGLQITTVGLAALAIANGHAILEV
jgi:hypothetical protein